MTTKTTKTAKITAKVLADMINTQRTADRKAGQGKATYAVTLDQMAPVAKAMGGQTMPTEVHTGGSANDRRVWCEQNGAVIVRVSDYCAKVNPQRPDNALRMRLIGWANIVPALEGLAYQRVAPTSKATEGDDRVYLYRVG